VSKKLNSGEKKYLIGVYITADVAGGALNAKELYHMSSYDSRWLDQQAAKQRIDWEVDSVGVSYSAEQEGVSL
jgi:hypothetical protein